MTGLFNGSNHNSFLILNTFVTFAAYVSKASKQLMHVSDFLKNPVHSSMIKHNYIKITTIMLYVFKQNYFIFSAKFLIPLQKIK